MQAERGDERRREERLLRAAVALPREEDRQRPVQDLVRHQADDGLVGVERALRQQDRPDAKRDAGGRSADGDEQQRAPAHRAKLRASPGRARTARRITSMPAAQRTKSSGRLA